jgi:hypothetical protein
LEPSSLLGVPLSWCCLEPPSFLSFTPRTVQRKRVINPSWSLGCDPAWERDRAKQW